MARRADFAIQTLFKLLVAQRILAHHQKSIGPNGASDSIDDWRDQLHSCITARQKRTNVEVGQIRSACSCLPGLQRVYEGASSSRTGSGFPTVQSYDEQFFMWAAFLKGVLLRGGVSFLLLNS
eukprot:4644635-Amphidinium_carterae.1